jgi:hypothetical protein
LRSRREGVADQQRASNGGVVGLTIDNVRLYIGFIQERHGSIGRSRLVGLHYCLGGPESAQCALGSSAAPIHRVPSSRPGDPIWNIGDW